MVMVEITVWLDTEVVLEVWVCAQSWRLLSLFVWGFSVCTLSAAGPIAMDVREERRGNNLVDHC